MINNYFSLLVALLLFTFPILSQDCSTFYPFSEGTTMQITSYGANKKIAAIVDYTVTEVNENQVYLYNTSAKLVPNFPVY